MEIYKQQSEIEMRHLSVISILVYGYVVMFVSSMKIVSATGLVGWWALEWAWQTFLDQSIGRRRDQYISVKIFYLTWKLWVPQAWAVCGR